MSNISFYDLDYIIDLNERRLEQYSDAYQKNLDKLTNILIIYSAIAVFIVPVIQSTFLGATASFTHYFCFFLFALLFSYSIFFTVRLLIPVNVAYLIEPKMYYESYRLTYEGQGRSQLEADKLIKASYIDELEKAVTINNAVFKKKGQFYYRALISGLTCCVPYIFCIAFHFANKSDEIQKVEIVNTTKNRNFNQSSDMSKSNNNSSNASSSSTTTTTTQLPGVNATDVKPSNPQMVKENFHDQSRKDGNNNAPKSDTNQKK